MSNIPTPAPSAPTPPRTWAIVVWALYLSGSITGGLGSIAGLIIAYIKRPEVAGTPYESHFTSAIRTFWIGLVGVLVGFVLMFVLIGIVVMIAVGIWSIFRSVRGLIKAVDGKPIDDPMGWM